LALGQFREAIVETIDQQGNNTSSEDYSTFAYVQRGTHVGIFEYTTLQPSWMKKGYRIRGGGFHTSHTTIPLTTKVGG